jgi:hypothetical protein
VLKNCLILFKRNSEFLGNRYIKLGRKKFWYLQTIDRWVRNSAKILELREEDPQKTDKEIYERKIKVFKVAENKKR